MEKVIIVKPDISEKENQENLKKVEEVLQKIANMLLEKESD